MAKSKRGPASVPDLHYHVVFNGGPALDHWTFAERGRAEKAQRWWNGRSNTHGQVAMIRECSLSEDACRAYRIYLTCSSCVGRA